MKYLTPEQILFIHARVMDETGGAHGVRDLGMLESAAARPRATFDGQDLHPTLFSKAASLLHALIKDHPFLDGNKRTAAVATGLFLEINGFPLHATNQELETFILKVTVSKITLSEIAEWLERKSK